jgi:hypothetical protein
LTKNGGSANPYSIAKDPGDPQVNAVSAKATVWLSASMSRIFEVCIRDSGEDQPWRYHVPPT